ncbi:hypothetical protein Bhyg_05868 [Pseudolycoriella hygida]|uniref:Uncharacterized protein n=1 Tax=Pseudolycoriella hygida TaxID=35572 RepID=A0A9Q0S2D8_9DIPT|nr:hypothetical protein Bhyg_05868 [Pseudolycoriella hygida]
MVCTVSSQATSNLTFSKDKKMAFHRHFYLSAVVLLFCVFASADYVNLNGFTTSYGMTGCLTDPTAGCGGSDICYSDRGNAYAISGTSPLCSACMPKGFRNIATYPVPQNLPCALWRAYECDNLFVNHVWYKSGSNTCWLGGAKSYNIANTHSSANAAQDEFISRCRQEKTLADYGLNATTYIINEEDFCFPLRNNITDIKILGANQQVLSVLTGYKEYYENKYGKITETESN